MREFKRLRPYYYGDYYPLTRVENVLKDNVWLAYQLNRPEKGDGIIMAFRRENCNEEFQEIKFRGLDPSANYMLFFEGSDSQIIATGSELMKGFQLKITEKKGSLLISYKKDQ